MKPTLVVVSRETEYLFAKIGKSHKALFFNINIPVLLFDLRFWLELIQLIVFNLVLKASGIWFINNKNGQVSFTNLLTPSQICSLFFVPSYPYVNLG